MNTYERMCTQDPMRGILAGLWKPKRGDSIYLEGKDPLGYWQRHDLLDEQDIQNLSVAEMRKLAFSGATMLAWLPTEGQLMKLQELIDAKITVYPRRETSVVITGNENFRSTLQEALLLALAHTQGLKWEGEKWERR